MKKLFYALILFASASLASVLHAGSKTYNLGAQAGTLNLTIEMYYGGDYSFTLVNNDTGQTIANINTVTSFDYSHQSPDWIWSDYFYGTSGAASLAGSWGSWIIDDVPAGNYSVVAYDSSHPDWVYDMSYIW
ncbi:MAG: hypothetical protein QM715_09180 [Nibricoccus sp.]